MSTMLEIEKLTESYAQARDELSSRLQLLRDEQEALRKRRMQGLKNSLARLTVARDELLHAVKDSEPLFAKPKTRTFHGVRIGWIVASGKLEIADETNTIRLIEKKLPDKAEALIKEKKSLIAAAVAELPAAELKSIGVSVGADTNTPFVKPVGDELDKLIKALLRRDNDVESAEEAVS